MGVEVGVPEEIVNKYGVCFYKIEDSKEGTMEKIKHDEGGVIYGRVVECRRKRNFPCRRASVTTIQRRRRRRRRIGRERGRVEG